MATHFSVDRRDWQATDHRVKKLDTTGQLSTHTGEERKKGVKKGPIGREPVCQDGKKDRIVF